MKATHEQYLNAMSETNGKPLRHTVIFESAAGPERSITQGDALILAIRGLTRIPGVSHMRAAHHSLDTPTIVEEMMLNSSTDLQNLRVDPVHNDVVEIARQHANWKVVDRLVVPETYALEDEKINEALGNGKQPLFRHEVLSFNEDVSDSDVQAALRAYEDALLNANDLLLFAPEVASSIDRRKGEVAIARTAWKDAYSLGVMRTSEDYKGAVSDLHDVASVTSATHIIDRS